MDFRDYYPDRENPPFKIEYHEHGTPPEYEREYHLELQKKQ